MTQSLPPKNIVFYADDDLDDLELVKDAFAQYAKDVEVLTATDGSKALSYLSNLKKYDTIPCLIILDVNMPVIDGKETLLRLRRLIIPQSSKKNGLIYYYDLAFFSRNAITE